MTQEIAVSPFVSALLEKKRETSKALDSMRAAIAATQAEAARKMGQLQEEEARLEGQLRHITDLLVMEGVEIEDEQHHLGSPTTEAHKRWCGDSDKSVADAAYELLKEAGKPLHYKELASRLLARGVPVGGKDPAATLISYLLRDGRFVRPLRRGIYALKEWNPKARSVGRRSKKARTKRRKTKRKAQKVVG